MSIAAGVSSLTSKMTTTTTTRMETDVLPFMVDDRQSSEASSEAEEPRKTTEWQSLVHLIKGYVGPGCLSLPWAISQLGVLGGVFACVLIGIWTSYNCWTIVKVKRHMSVAHGSRISYPDVGGWAYGPRFRQYVAISVCIQQLAVCTVFLSFVGANLLALAERLFEVDVPHAMVITWALPAAVALSCLPDLKALAPVMLIATLLLLLGFLLIGVVVGTEWHHRPETLPPLNWNRMPLAVCAVLYSYEGICLVLPVESAMEHPHKFQRVFVTAMTLVTVVFAVVASLCVVAFGAVTNGSITAFLLETDKLDLGSEWVLLMANTVVSISVLLTYPLQLFPTLELVGPWLMRRRFLSWCSKSSSETATSDAILNEPSPREPTADFAPLHSGSEDDDDDDEELDNDHHDGNDGVLATAPTSPIVTPQTRLCLVLCTYIVAVAVPNVQAMISLAGAVSGSSTALLIPPMVDLAWRHKTGTDTIGAVLHSYALLALGVAFFLIGTFASMDEIYQVYAAE